MRVIVRKVGGDIREDELLPLGITDVVHLFELPCSDRATPTAPGFRGHEVTLENVDTVAAPI